MNKVVYPFSLVHTDRLNLRSEKIGYFQKFDAQLLDFEKNSTPTRE